MTHSPSVPTILKQALVLFAHSPKKEVASKRFFVSRADKAQNENIHSALLESTIEQIYSALTDTVFDVIISSDAPENIASILLSNNSLLLDFTTVFVQQQGESFEERLHHTLKSVSNLGYEHIVVIGADTPELSAHEITSAFVALSSGEKSVVLGESTDGGVYVIGAQSRIIPQLLEDIRWQSANVFADVQRNVREHRFTAHFLPPFDDIDTLADLAQWLAKAHDSSLAALQRRITAILATRRTKLSFTAQSFPAVPRLKRLRIQMQKAPPIA
ncbi:MAG: DUF2064 domain-containing protein [Candidatus Kapabacteria bacterium]|jgi:glycosyltransferase A (GT-A) superfamily protein (DUF2064 family)|nr:DUF2064 domain-containing protein [Candidatus Kapabacteria bacterium]